MPDEHCAASSTGARIAVLNQSMKTVLLWMATSRASAGWASAKAQQINGAGSTAGSLLSSSAGWVLSASRLVFPSFHWVDSPAYHSA